jgi:hypothetical protein
MACEKSKEETIMGCFVIDADGPLLFKYRQRRNRIGTVRLSTPSGSPRTFGTPGMTSRGIIFAPKDIYWEGILKYHGDL